MSQEILCGCGLEKVKLPLNDLIAHIISTKSLFSPCSSRFNWFTLISYKCRLKNLKGKPAIQKESSGIL